jgi:Zn-dependent M28 family amino/carboxypeptidase
MAYNTVAEIPGTDLKDQVVMVGGHLDSWHSGTGATDNAVGAVAAMEAVRIIQSLNLHPRRTIRVALWTGEEQGIFGSSNYVKQHFGYDPDARSNAQRFRRVDDASVPPDVENPAATQAAMRPARRILKQPDYEKLSVYFNLDNGSGKIRGVYAQSNPAAIPLFKQWLAYFADLGATTVTVANTGSTDHVSFDQIGLPGFQFIQDQLEYSSRTHHSNQDVYDRLQPDDVKQASTILAGFLWKAAQMDERFPRKPLDARP